MILLLRISLLACVVTGLTPPQCSLRPSTRVASSSTDISRTTCRDLIMALSVGHTATRRCGLVGDGFADLFENEVRVDLHRRFEFLVEWHWVVGLAHALNRCIEIFEAMVHNG